MPGLTLATNTMPPPPPSQPGAGAAGAQHPGAATQQHPPTAAAATPGPARAATRSRSASPARPPVSPITPTMRPAEPAQAVPPPAATLRPPFAQGRPAYAHAAQPDQSASGAAVLAPPPPAPEPLDLDANPDALALRSAISILQLQRARAARDIRALHAAKEAALAQPGAFVRDLAGGRVRTEGDRLFTPQGGEGAGGDEGSDDSDDSGDSGSDDARRGAPDSGGAGKAHPERAAAPAGEAWSSLPRPQNVVRCPPVNWAQYAVVGESLDRLHADQQAAPSEGAPAVVGPDGRVEFRGEPGADGTDQKRLVGVAAPYAPGRDKLDKKPRGSKR